MNTDRALGIAAIALAVAMGIASSGYAAAVAYEPVGPRAFPLLIAAALAVCGAFLLFRPVHDAGFTRDAVRRTGLCITGVLIYALLFQVFGFILSTVLMTVGVGRLFGGVWRQCLTAGAGLGIGLYVLFDRLLDVVLPSGLIGPVLTLLGQ